jgi:hypothetical protein
MNITITELIENPDGSADAKIELDADAHKYIVQEGFVSLLMKGIQHAQEESKQSDED